MKNIEFEVNKRIRKQGENHPINDKYLFNFYSRFKTEVKAL